MDTLKIIGNKIRDKRKNKQINIQQLADRIDVAYGTMANIESGNKKPTIEQLSKIGEVLNCDWKDFLHDDNGKLLNDINLIQELLDENERVDNERKIKIKSHIENAIGLSSLGWSPTGGLLTEQDLNEVQYMVYELIKIRLGQIANSKQNK